MLSLFEGWSFSFTGENKVLVILANHADCRKIAIIFLEDTTKSFDHTTERYSDIPYASVSQCTQEYSMSEIEEVFFIIGQEKRWLSMNKLTNLSYFADNTDFVQKIDLLPVIFTSYISIIQRYIWKFRLKFVFILTESRRIFSILQVQQIKKTKLPVKTKSRLVIHLKSTSSFKVD